MAVRIEESLAFIGDGGLCPICGASITIVDVCRVGRLIGSCRDAFWIRQWVADCDDDSD
jgi:hypothetical protein